MSRREYQNVWNLLSESCSNPCMLNKSAVWTIPSRLDIKILSLCANFASPIISKYFSTFLFHPLLLIALLLLSRWNHSRLGYYGRKVLESPHDSWNQARSCFWTASTACKQSLCVLRLRREEYATFYFTILNRTTTQVDNSRIFDWVFSSSFSLLSSTQKALRTIVKGDGNPPLLQSRASGPMIENTSAPEEEKMDLDSDSESDSEPSGKRKKTSHMPIEETHDRELSMLVIVTGHLLYLYSLDTGVLLEMNHVFPLLFLLMGT